MSISAQVTKIITESVDRLFTQDDFAYLPRVGVSLALSRLAKKGLINRVSQGVYYRPQKTIVGQTKVGQGRLEQLLLKGARPTGPSAAVLLGFSTKHPVAATYAISQRDPVTRLKGTKMVRQRQAHDLTLIEGALLEFIRDRAQYSELSDEMTVAKLIKFFEAKDCFENLARASLQEPPRVRAILGAIGEEIKAPEDIQSTLAKSLNQTSKFDFGRLGGLTAAKEWQAKNF